MSEIALRAPLRFRIAMLARNNPTIMSVVGRRRERSWNQRRVLRPGDDILIDGFPRSANTFATYAFTAAQPRRPAIGNHLHSPAQFKIAAKHGIPAMLAVRDPLAAVSSYMIYRQDIDARIGLMRYVAFHEPLHSIRHNFVVAPFEEVTQDFGLSIERLNQHFGTDFALFRHTVQSAREILKQIDADRRLRWKIEGGAPDASPLSKDRALELLMSPKLRLLRDAAYVQYKRILEFS